MVIQGFGNVGGMAAKLMERAGFKVIAIVEYDGAVYNDKGLDIRALAEHRQKTGSVVGFRGRREHGREEAFFLETRRADAGGAGERDHVAERAPGAHEDSVRGREWSDHASGGSDSAREGDLRDPGYSGECGRRDGVLLRMGAGPQGYFWNEQLVNDRLEEIMINSFNDVVAYAEKHGVDNRTAAYMLALDRVAFAIKLRGIYA